MALTALARNYGLPLLLKIFLEYNAMNVALLLPPVVGRVVSRVNLRGLVTFGLFSSGTALMAMGSHNTQVGKNTLMLLWSWQTLGIAFLFITISTVAYMGIPEGANKQAASMLAFIHNRAVMSASPYWSS